MQTQAAILYERNAPVVIETLSLEDPKQNEVLVRMVTSGVCHSDLSVVNGTIPYELPLTLGHEGAGVVEKIGEGVTYVKPGDHVILSFVSYCGECFMCQKERVCLCETFTAARGHLLDDTPRLSNQAGAPISQMNRIGTMAEYSVVPEQSLVKIEQRYSLQTAALVGCGVTTGVGAVLNTAQVEPGSTVAVIGAGGVGLNVIQGAVLAGAQRIIAVDRLANKLELSKSFGATDLVNASEVDPIETVIDLCEGRGADYAFEAIGLQTTIEQAYGMIRPFGMAVIVGITDAATKVEIPSQVMTRTERRLVGSYYGSCNPRIDMPKLLNLHAEGKIKLDELISQTYRLEQINEAFEDLEAGKNARGILVFD
ncbi:MAG: Zn-dependent alcohol dehydrogenase [Chloroflexota bacterium]